MVRFFGMLKIHVAVSFTILQYYSSLCTLLTVKVRRLMLGITLLGVILYFCVHITPVTTEKTEHATSKPYEDLAQFTKLS